ncbi:MAG: ABC transporter ATP-binding protein [Planctomycetes bacterium]|nr:ABC transporter ATP-binding protein [Planctomycetota bacterium]
MRIELIGLSKRYGGLKALDEVDLEIEPGQIVAVLGLNGAGKTTLLRCLAGIAAPDRGMIRYDGERFARDRLDLRRKFFFLPDFPPLLPGGTLIHHLTSVLKLYEADAQPGWEDRIVGLLKDFDLLPLIDAPAQALSRGQAYKSALAGLLAVDPELWLLDEPFASGMDPHGISSFKRASREAAKRGRTVLYTTQLLDLAEAFSDRVCVIHKGQVRAFDRLEALRAAMGSNGGVLEDLFARLRAEDGDA